MKMKVNGAPWIVQAKTHADAAAYNARDAATKTTDWDTHMTDAATKNTVGSSGIAEAFGTLIFHSVIANLDPKGYTAVQKAAKASAKWTATGGNCQANAASYFAHGVELVLYDRALSDPTAMGAGKLKIATRAALKTDDKNLWCLVNRYYQSAEINPCAGTMFTKPANTELVVCDAGDNTAVSAAAQFSTCSPTMQAAIDGGWAVNPVMTTSYRYEGDDCATALKSVGIEAADEVCAADPTTTTTTAAPTTRQLDATATTAPTDTEATLIAAGTCKKGIYYWDASYAEKSICKSKCGSNASALSLLGPLLVGVFGVLLA